MQPSEVHPGDAVLYVAGLNHAFETGAAGGDGHFHFEYVKDGPMRKGKPSARKGERVVHWEGIGQFSKRDHETGHVETHGGHVLRPVCPKDSWKAVVLAVGAEGRLDLQIDHPHGHKLEYFGVPFSAEGDLHSWHLTEKGA